MSWVARRDLASLTEYLTERDKAVLDSIEQYRLLSTRLIQRLYFADGHATAGAATRACTRVLARLQGHGLIVHLDRRIGGVRRGSAGYVWQLAATGERLIRETHGGEVRKRFLEPSGRFVKHTLAVAEMAVRLHESTLAGRFDLVTLDTEPQCWRPFLGGHGRREIVKPDLFVVTANGEYEDHWFIEVDLASEHLPAISKKLRSYLSYAATGIEQSQHEMFPAVLWVVPDEQRGAQIQQAIDELPNVSTGMFRITTGEQFIDAIVSGANGNEPEAAKEGKP
ncbi:MAG: replication-relaxation family protein [Actinomycetes bacterium]